MIGENGDGSYSVRGVGGHPAR